MIFFLKKEHYNYYVLKVTKQIHLTHKKKTVNYQQIITILWKLCYWKKKMFSYILVIFRSVFVWQCMKITNLHEQNGTIILQFYVYFKDILRNAYF